MAGRPKGSRNDRIWGAALRKAALEYAEGKAGPKKIEIAAKRLVEAVMNGDVSAAKEFGERIDGKVPQAHVGDDDSDPIRVIAKIERSIVDPGSK